MRLEELFRQYRDRMDFYVVYIQEAHPSDEWQMDVNVEQDVVFEQPKTYEQREAVAQACSLGLDVSIPMLIDEMDDATNRAYGAVPDRLFLVRRRGQCGVQGRTRPDGLPPGRPGSSDRADASERSRNVLVRVVFCGPITVAYDGVTLEL